MWLKVTLKCKVTLKSRNSKKLILSNFKYDYEILLKMRRKTLKKLHGKCICYFFWTKFLISCFSNWQKQPCSAQTKLWVRRESFSYPSISSSSRCPMAWPRPSGKLVILLKDKLSCRSDLQLTLGSRVTSGPTQFLETLSALSDSRDSSSMGSDWSWLPCRSSRVRFLRFCIRKVNQKVNVVKKPRPTSGGLQTGYLTEGRGELQQAVVAQIQAEQVSQLLLNEAVVHQAGQGVQLVARQVQQADLLLVLGRLSRALAAAEDWGGGETGKLSESCFCWCKKPRAQLCAFVFFILHWEQELHTIFSLS